MTKSPAGMLDDAVDIASLPEVYTRLTQALDNPHTSTGLIADIISEDSGLTARLLRLVNSAFYGFPVRVETVSRAVMIVGTRQIADLALATSVMSAFDGIPADLVDMESFWLHGVTTGLAARNVASHRGASSVERFFVAGVLHDIGRLVLFKREPAAMRGALLRCAEGGELLLSVERELFGFDHAALGGALLRAWKLPESLEDMVAFHHAPARCTHSEEAALIHVADVLAHATRIGSSGSTAVPPLEATAWTLLGLEPNALRGLLDRTERQVDDAIQVVRLAAA